MTEAIARPKPTNELRSVDNNWWTDAHERPEWVGELQQVLVDAGLCAWDAHGKPHPQEFALVVHWYLRAGAGER